VGPKEKIKRGQIKLTEAQCAIAFWRLVLWGSPRGYRDGIGRRLAYISGKSADSRCDIPDNFAIVVGSRATRKLMRDSPHFRIVDHPSTIFFGFWRVKLNLGRYTFPEFAVTWRGESMIRTVRA